MATEIKMPQLGESVVEGTITKWLKQEGDSIDEDELLVEVSTDKVDSEVPSSAAGTIEKILVQEGETVKVGTAIALVGEGGESSGGEESADREEPAAEAPDKEPESESRPEERQEPAAEAEEQAAPGDSEEAGDEADEAVASKEDGASGKAAEAGDTSKRGIISPLVRRLADEHSVDLDRIEGTGTGGRIRKQDVLKFVEQEKSRPAAKATEQAEEAPAPKEERREPARTAAPAAAPERAAGERETLVPWTNIRKRTAEHMVASSREVARAWNAVEVDWTNVAKLRARAKESFRAKEGFGLTYMPFLAKSLCETLLEMPVINSTYDADQQGNVEKHYVNLGIAVALDGGGLIVPVIKGADEKNLVGLARSVYDVATRARSKKLTPDDLTGGTYSITNPGPFGSIISVPIIPRSQTAILGFEAITKQVVATEDDQIAIRHRGILDMSWDHRAIDGAEAARFLARLKERIETTDFSAELQQYS
jgi:pyruvate dehydrogenase E2 component (dihydrolipoamide acetyltransferase)